MRLFFAIFILVLCGAAVIAVLLFMLIFPLINKLFGTNIPCYGGVWDEVDFNTPLKRKKKKEAASEQIIKIKKKELESEQSKKTKNKAAKRSEELEPQEQKKPLARNINEPRMDTQKNELKKNDAKNYYYDRNVPTVRIPPVNKNIKQHNLTAAKIEAAARIDVTTQDGTRYNQKEVAAASDTSAKPKVNKEKAVLNLKVESEKDGKTNVKKQINKPVK